VRFRPWVYTLIILLTAAVWATDFVAGLAIRGYMRDEHVSAIFGLIVGAMFIARRRANRDDDDREGQ
jgi:hypothetical protein